MWAAVPTTKAGRLRLLFAVILMITGASLSILLGMDAAYDTANYHWFNGRALLGGYLYTFGAIAGFHTLLNPLLDGFGVAVFSMSPRFGAAAMGGLYGLTVTILVGLTEATLPGRPRQRLGLALFGSLVGASAPMALSQVGSFMGESLNAIFIIAGFFLLHRAVRHPDTRTIAAGGALLGAAVAFKLTALPYAIGGSVGLLLLPRRKIRNFAAYGAGAAGAFLALNGPFMVALYSEYKNPVFPFLNDIFRSPYAPPTPFSFSPFTLADLPFYLSLPLRWLAAGYTSEEPSIRDGRILLGFAASAVIVTKVLRYRYINCRNLLFLPVVYATSFLIWILVFRIYRYLVPVELLSGALVAEAIGLTFFAQEAGHLQTHSDSTKRLPQLLMVIIAAFLTATTAYPEWGRRPFDTRFAQAEYPFELNTASMVVLTDERLSYLIPDLRRTGANFVNPSPGFIDPHTKRIREGDQVFSLSYDGPEGTEARYSFLLGQRRRCRTINTNWPHSAPMLCQFGGPRQPLTSGKIYDYNGSEDLVFISWDNPGEAYRWSLGTASEIRFIRPTGVGDMCLVLVGAMHGDQRIEAIAEGRELASTRWGGEGRIVIPLPHHLNQDVRIILHFPDAQPPGNGDPRKLALALRTLQVLEGASCRP